MNKMDKPGGTLSAESHSYQVRVYYEDTDAAGIVFYANYLKYAERARTEMLRGLGFAHADIMRERGTVFVVRHCEIDYQHSAWLDEELEIRTAIEAIGGASLTLKQWVYRGGEELVAMKIKLVCMKLEGKGTTRIPDDIRQALDGYILRVGEVEHGK
ncbi:MAG: tol-pal system-associated acyl-CoA thioesterase [Rhodospirillales bacterium]|jgi:acyl-CoA thioester hydrolase|nr:tol-pal system-associated acyl-CoA thioesterase [Rhodospirillales bacterium]